jgi:U4/U6 small nuclear ribonucleoprotein PRP3
LYRYSEGASAARAAAVLDPIPDVEWWDAHILTNGTYDDIAGGKWNVKPEKINLYVEHPVPMDPPMEAPEPPPQPLKLTKKEQKKLRTQRRLAREQEKQEMIKQGLLEPPKAKVKISNLMRVLTDEATADPTAVEKEVREQMAERAEAHDDRNEVGLYKVQTSCLHPPWRFAFSPPLSSPPPYGLSTDTFTSTHSLKPPGFNP